MDMDDKQLSEDEIDRNIGKWANATFDGAALDSKVVKAGRDAITSKIAFIWGTDYRLLGGYIEDIYYYYKTIYLYFLHRNHTEMF